MATAKKRIEKKSETEKTNKVDPNLVLVANEMSERLGFNKPDKDGHVDPIPADSNKQLIKDIKEELNQDDIGTFSFSKKVCNIVKDSFGVALNIEETEKPAKKSKTKKAEKVEPVEEPVDEKPAKAKKSKKAKVEKPAKVKKEKKADKPKEKAAKSETKKGRAYDKTSASSRLWLLWDNGEGITDPEKLFKKLNEDIKIQSIKWYIQQWSKGEKLPGIAKAE